MFTLPRQDKRIALVSFAALSHLLSPASHPAAFSKLKGIRFPATGSAWAGDFNSASDPTHIYKDPI